ncbi:hypothetical protein EON65_21110 [archaeon]|nr:MAG: hypothetical protein EON65_21110 [archaeon]
MTRKVSHKSLKKASADQTTISSDSFIFPVPPTPGTPTVSPRHLLDLPSDKRISGNSHSVHHSVHPQPPAYPKSSVIKEFGNPLLNPARAKHTLSASSSRKEELSKELPVKKSVWYEPTMGGEVTHMNDSMHSHNSTLSSDFYQLLRSSDRTISTQKVVSHDKTGGNRPGECMGGEDGGLIEPDLVSDKSLFEITK